MHIYIVGSKQWNGRPAYLSTANAGGGSHLDPPNYHSHFVGIVAGYDHGNGYQEYSSVDYYLNNPNVPVSAKHQLRLNTKRWKPAEIPDHAWVISVLKYFHNCYSPDGIEWAQHLIWIPVGGHTYGDLWQHFKRKVDMHCGVHHIRKYYPNFKPSITDWKEALNGKGK